jgi:1-acyl-sn-glycerol-3-phosphate acyltransferase
MATPESFFYSMARNLVSCVFDTVYRMETHGASGVPRRGPFIIAVNHASLLDPPVVGFAVPRPLYFMARRTLFKSRGARWLFPKLNGIPIDREGADTGALKKALTVLRRGDGLLFFPEGTRTRDGNLNAAKPGIGMVACRTRAPVVPTRIFGTYDAWGTHTRVPLFVSEFTVVFGRPLSVDQYDPGKGCKDRYQIAADRIMGAIGDLSLPVETAT